MKTKRLLSVLTLAALLPLAASADVYQDPETKVNYEYTVGQSEASVTSSSDVSGDIAILSSFTVDGNEYSVTSIGTYAFYNCRNLKSVIIPEGVTIIGNDAFNNCDNLNSVTIPKSATSIGNYAFSGCSELTSVAIPEGIISIGGSAFSGCIGLTSIVIPKSVDYIGEYAFFACSGLNAIMVASGNTTYDSRNNCNAIIETSSNSLIAGCKNTIIPESVNSIGSSAFQSCRSMTSITIPEGVTTIGNGAFAYCSGLTTISIPESVSSIGNYAFYGCTSLTSITSLIQEPFKVYSIVSDETYSNATLYVPAGTIDAYKATADWNKFEKIVEIGDDTTDIEAIVSNGSEGTAKERYALDGHRLDSATKGLNLVRMTDGTVKKVVVK